MGYDTAVRLIEPRFYHDDPAQMRAAFEAIRAAGCRFFVAGRVKDDRFLTWRDLALPDELHDLFDGFTEQEFRIDLSSTELRQNKGDGHFCRNNAFDFVAQMGFSDQVTVTWSLHLELL